MVLDQETTNVLLYLIKKQDDFDKVYLYAKHLSEAKYECLIKKTEYTRANDFSDPNAFLMFK